MLQLAKTSSTSVRPSSLVHSPRMIAIAWRSASFFWQSAQLDMHCCAVACCRSEQRLGSALGSVGRGRTNGGGAGGLMPWPTQEVAASSRQTSQLARQWSQRWVPTGTVGASHPTAAIWAAQSYLR